MIPKCFTECNAKNPICLECPFSIDCSIFKMLKEKKNKELQSYTEKVNENDK